LLFRGGRIRGICRALKCTRIAIHIQLFLSFAFNNFMWIIWYYFVVGDTPTVEQNGVSI
jgi:calcitonin receptor-like